MQKSITAAYRTNGVPFILGVAALWMGLIVGVSFIATPVKFLAPSLSLAVALDVGRHTFFVFNRIEIAVALVLLALCAWRGRTWLMVGLGVALLACVLAETFWLLPALDAQVTTIIAGGVPPPSPLHLVYIAVDLLKLVALLILIVHAFRVVLRMAAVSPAASLSS